jgi:hypothetical protein
MNPYFFRFRKVKELKKVQPFPGPVVSKSFPFIILPGEERDNKFHWIPGALSRLINHYKMLSNPEC